MQKARLLKRWRKMRHLCGPSFKLIGGKQGKRFSCVFSLGEYVLLDYQKSVQPFSFVRILIKNDKIIAQIFQLQCLLFGEIVSTTVEDGS